MDIPAIVGGCLENSSSFLESFGGFLAPSSSLLRRLLKGGGFYFYDSGPPHTQACLDYAVLHTNWARPVVECQCTVVRSTQKSSENSYPHNLTMMFILFTFEKIAEKWVD